MASLSRLGVRTISTPPTRTAVAQRASPLFSSFSPSTRRLYASQASQNAKSSELPWMIGSVVVTVPAIFYLMKSKPEAPHGLKPHRSVTKETEAHEEEKEGSQDSEKSEAPSERDPPKATKPTTEAGKQSGAQSSKQQGLSNTETKHPHLDAPGKSVKAEGETDTAKLQGTVSTKR